MFAPLPAIAFQERLWFLTHRTGVLQAHRVMADSNPNTNPSSYLALSESARLALERLCGASGIKDPVVTFYGSSGVLSGTDSFDALVASGVSEKDLYENAREIAKRNVEKLEFKLVVQCVPRDEIPEEFIVLLDGIAVNAPAHATWRGPKVLLDWRENEFFLIGPTGVDLFELSISILKGNHP